MSPVSSSTIVVKFYVEVLLLVKSHCAMDRIVSRVMLLLVNLRVSVCLSVSFFSHNGTVLRVYAVTIAEFSSILLVLCLLNVSVRE